MPETFSWCRRHFWEISSVLETSSSSRRHLLSLFRSNFHGAGDIFTVLETFSWCRRRFWGIAFVLETSSSSRTHFLSLFRSNFYGAGDIFTVSETFSWCRIHFWGNFFCAGDFLIIPDTFWVFLEAIFMVPETFSRCRRLFHGAGDTSEGFLLCWRLPYHPRDTFEAIFIVLSLFRINFHSARDIFMVPETLLRDFFCAGDFLIILETPFEPFSLCWRLLRRNFHGARDSFWATFRVLGTPYKLFSQCWRHLRTHFLGAGDFFMVPEELLRDFLVLKNSLSRRTPL